METEPDQLELITPALAEERDQTAWARVLRTTGVERLEEQEAHAAVLRYAVDALHPFLLDGTAPEIDGLVAAAQESDDGWTDATAVARRIERTAEISVATIFLLAQRTTSGAADSSWAGALSATARALVAQEPGVGGVAAEIEQKHQAVLMRFLSAQRTLTAQILEGIESVVLHRALRLEGVPEAGEFDPAHGVLAGHSLDPPGAISLARYGQDAASHGGRVVLLSGKVPATRILSTPATGFGSFVEQEFVLLHGLEGDRVTLTHAG